MLFVLFLLACFLGTITGVYVLKLIAYVFLSKSPILMIRVAAFFYKIITFKQIVGLYAEHFLSSYFVSLTAIITAKRRS